MTCTVTRVLSITPPSFDIDVTVCELQYIHYNEYNILSLLWACECSACRFLVKAEYKHLIQPLQELTEWKRGTTGHEKRFFAVAFNPMRVRSVGAETCASEKGDSQTGAWSSLSVNNTSKLPLSDSSPELYHPYQKSPLYLRLPPSPPRLPHFLTQHLSLSLHPDFFPASGLYLSSVCSPVVGISSAKAGKYRAAPESQSNFSLYLQQVIVTLNQAHHMRLFCYSSLYFCRISSTASQLPHIEEC